LLKLREEFLQHLTGGGTLLVPSRQRATAVRLSYATAMLAGGSRVWDSPDVLPWPAWLERELDLARERGVTLPRRLTSMEEWLLWQQSVYEASAGFGVLMPDGLIDPVRRAIGLMDDFGLSLDEAPTAETAVLRQARLLFDRRCQEWNVIGRASWRVLAAFIQPTGDLMLAGFNALGPERRRWLESLGARIPAEVDVAAPLPAGARTVACDSPPDEAQRAATWCASQLAADTGARLLVIVPQLHEQRHQWERAFSQQLDAAGILQTDGSRGVSNFVIEGGRPLAEYRLVVSAMNLLSLATGRARFDQLSEVMRSPYFAKLDGDAWYAVERWLRDHNVGTASLSALAELEPRVTRELGETVGQALRQWLDLLRGRAPSNAATPDVWAQAWAAQLERCGWPGSALSSDEQQVRMRFDELLGEFAAVVVPPQHLTQAEAWQCLQSMAARIAFEPASDDVPVTLTRRLEDPVARYDGIWIAGLSSDVWPPAARPDPLLPLAWQRHVGVPEASADGQLRQAQQLMQQWRASAEICVFSYFRSDQDLRKDSSPLLPVTPVEPPAGAEHVSADQWLTANLPVLETWTDQTVPTAPLHGFLKGGTRLLELQSLCPFRAFAELRLEATPLENPQPGIHPKLRGMILHGALEQFWKHVADQATLRDLTSPELEQIALQCAATAVNELAAREPTMPGAGLLQREQSRTVRLILRLVEWELKRPKFITRILESPLQYRAGDVVLDLRLDRVDQLEDGRLVVLDYKTGGRKRFDGSADRLPQPQLPAYAIASGSQSAAVVTLYVNRDGVKASGLQDRKGRIPRLATLKDGEPDWTARTTRWRQQLDELIAQYVAGDAAVRPQSDACKYCHIHALCRIDAATLAALDTDPDGTSVGDGENDGETESESDVDEQ
jgi:ATP-dependent helicase/nuclease subunit B